VAFTTFNNVSLLNLPLTSDYFAIESALAFHGTAFLGGLSSLSDGLNSAKTMLTNLSSARPWASRVILLVSDGNENFGIGAMNAARQCAQANIMIYTISVGSDANGRLMGDLATATHGRYLHAGSPDKFVVAVEDMNQHLPVLLTH
jgi:Mg-chelatase subunit ChlD